MADAIRLVHTQSGLEKTGFTGFSWTSFFFSGIPAITRGDVGIGLGVLIGTLILGGFSFGLLGFVVNLIWAFVYNKMYTTKLIENGYRIVGSDEEMQRAAQELGIQSDPELSPRGGTADYDRRKWEALVQYDPDIRRIAEKLAPYGQKYVDQLASGYLALNDKNYLPQIIQSILETAKADASREASRSVIEEGTSYNFGWKKYSDGVLEARIDRKWREIESIDQLKSLSPTRGV